MARDGVDTRQAGPSRVLMRVPARLTRVLATDGSGPETVLALWWSMDTITISQHFFTDSPFARSDSL